MDVLCSAAARGSICVCAICAAGGHGVGSVDDLNVEAGAKGLHVGDDHLLVRGRSRGRKELRELREAESGDDASDAGHCVTTCQAR